MKKPSFEESIGLIDEVIEMKRGKWTLKAISWMDFDDVAQIIRHHIYKKWHLYNPKKPIQPWINTIASHQIKNLIRNLYGNHSRPCLRCAANEGGDLCAIYVKQCQSCPLFARWERKKKPAFDSKLTLSLEDHTDDVNNRFSTNIDYIHLFSKLDNKLKLVLSESVYAVFKALYIDHIEEADLARSMGLKIHEKRGKKLDYNRQIDNYKKKIYMEAREIIEKEGLD